MKKERVLNLATVAIVAGLASIAAGGIWGLDLMAGQGRSVVTCTPGDTACSVQLGANPGPGKVLAIGTGTNTHVSEYITPPWVNGTGSLTGTLNYIPKKTAGGWGDSQVSDDGSSVRVGGGSSSAKLSANGSIQASGGSLISDPNFGIQAAYYIADGISRIWSFANASGYGLSYYQDGGSHPGGVTGDSICFHFGSQTNPPYCVKSDGSIYSAGGLTLAGLPGLGVGNVLYVSSSGGVISAKSLTATDVGAEPTLSACSPGQVPQYTGTGTGTSTAKGCGTVATIGNGFDPLGTYFLHTCEGPCFLRWGTFSPSTAVTSSATCSTGSDALIAEFFAGETYDFENRILWPGGSWLAKLNAKVNANGAAIRVEVWDTDGAGGYSQWFNWTTDAFTNTAFSVIQKSAQATERVVASREHRVFFRLYATCSTSTTVTLQYADGSSRIESPIAKEATTSVADVDGLTAALSAKEPALSPGRPGQGVGYLGTGTATGTTKGPIDLEAITTGVPGQFVKFLGTGTATTTSKGGVDVTIPTPVTTRSFTVAASALNLGSGAVAGNLSSGLAIWTLRNAQSDFAYGAVITIPNDYVSGLSVAPMWYPIGADSTTTHKVKWAIGHMSMADAASFTLTYTSWTGKECGTPCSATYALVNEAAFGFGSYAAGNEVAIGIKRLGSDAADTYTGDLAFAGLKFTYTSSL